MTYVDDPETEMHKSGLVFELIVWDAAIRSRFTASHLHLSPALRSDASDVADWTLSVKPLNPAVD